MTKFGKLICVAALALAASVSASAQNGPYLSNGTFDNTFIGVAGGINTLLAPGNTNYITADLEAYAGKWWTPCVGGRIGYQGLKLRETYYSDYQSHYIPSGADYRGEQTVTYGFGYFHGDLMWNVLNNFCGYKERLFELVPYAHTGLLHIYNPGSFFSTNQDNEFAAGAGILGMFNVTNKLAITVDVRDIIFSSRFHNYSTGGAVQTLTASAGLQYKIGKTGWAYGEDNTATAAALAAAEAALAAARKSLADANQNVIDLTGANGKLTDQVKALTDELEALKKNQPASDVVYVKTALGVAPLTLFYELDKDQLNVTELRHLDDYVNAVLAADPDRTFVLTGSADKGTGTYDHNVDLAARRSAGVKAILEKKYKVASEHIVVAEGKVSDEHADPKLDRSVVVKH